MNPLVSIRAISSSLAQLALDDGLAAGKIDAGFADGWLGQQGF